MSQVAELSPAKASQEPFDAADAVEVARNYLIRFYPLWFTCNQARGPHSRMFCGPDKITPIFQTVVAINVDTLYASIFMDLTDEPVVVTVPQTTVTYSMLPLDPYGTILQTNVKPQTPGVYAFVGPHSKGRVPANVHVVPVPVDFPIVLFRADRHAADGTPQEREAEAFRKALKGQSLSTYLKNPAGGAALILPESSYALPFKTDADVSIANDPIGFLAELQAAVAAPATPPLTPAALALSERFNQLFAYGDYNDQLGQGAQAGHAALLQNYLTHLDRHNWISFQNIGHWGSNLLDRASITEFIQYGNGFSTAAYFHAFRDADGNALDGGRRYTLHFRKEQLPQATRFWSITAYTPQAIELVANDENKYVVARYTPDLQYDADGGLTVQIAARHPAGTPKANWLPVPERGPFNIMLRVYGPEGRVASGDYTPPPIDVAQG
jgi:hypothetical protein